MLRISLNPLQGTPLFILTVEITPDGLEIFYVDNFVVSAEIVLETQIVIFMANFSRRNVLIRVTILL